MSRPDRRLVCTIIGAKYGGSAWTPDLQPKAIICGALAANVGFVVLTGGHSGVMEFAANGAKRAGGLTVGILRTDAHSDANAFIDIVLPTGMGVGRNVLTALAADVVIALKGSMGTLQELAYAIDFHKPILTWGAWDQFAHHPNVTCLPDEATNEQIEAWLLQQREVLWTATK